MSNAQDPIISESLEQEIKARLRVARDLKKCPWNRDDMLDEFTAIIDDVLAEKKLRERVAK
jgi:hypothetical protein